MASISDKELKSTVEELLSENDLQEMTLRKIMRSLAQTFSCSTSDLASKKSKVRTIVEEYLSANNPEEDDDDSDASSSEEEAMDEKPKKRASARRKVEKVEEESEEEAPQWKPVVLSGLSKAVILDEPLADLLGVKVLGRSDIQKGVIAYVKKHELQDEVDKRRILTDDALKGVFNVENFTFFGLSKLISDHVSRVEDCDDDDLKGLAREADEAKLQQMKADRAEKIANGELPPVSAAAKRKLKEKAANGGGKQKKRARGPGTGPPPNTGLNAPMTLSDGLSEVCGGEKVLSRPQVVKALWTYIKENKLKDPNDGRNIICDDKLSKLFDNEKQVNGFGMNKYLSRHLSKIAAPQT